MQSVDVAQKAEVKAPAIPSVVMSWVVCLCSSLYFFYEFVQLNIFNSINFYIMEDFGLDAVQAANMASLYFYANLIFLFPAGLILDRFSPRKVIILSMMAASTSTVIFGYTDSLILACIARFVVGIGAAFCFLSCIRIASRWFPPQKLALVTGVVVTMAMLGGAVAQAPFAHLIQFTGSWRESMMLNGALGFVITAVIFFTVRDFPPGKCAITERHQTGEQLGVIKSLLFVMKSFQNWVCGIFTSLLNLPIFLLGAIWGIMYLNQVHGLTEEQASYATFMLFIGTIVGSPAFGLLSDLLLKRKLPMILGSITSLISMLILMYVPGLSFVEIMALFFAIGFFTSAQVLSYPLIAEHNPINMTSTALSIASSCIMISGIVAQPLFAWFIERGWDHTFVNGQPSYSVADINNGMLIMPLMFVVSLILTFFIKDSQYHVNEKKELERE